MFGDVGKIADDSDDPPLVVVTGGDIQGDDRPLAATSGERQFDAAQTFATGQDAAEGKLLGGDGGAVRPAELPEEVVVTAPIEFPAFDAEQDPGGGIGVVELSTPVERDNAARHFFENLFMSHRPSGLALFTLLRPSATSIQCKFMI